MKTPPLSPSPSLVAAWQKRATHWQLRTRTLEFGQRPLVMGIVNVTPDSFSDGGRFFSTAKAIAHGLQLAADGADIIDVGGESTRPYSTPVDAAEELRRVQDVVAELVKRVGVPISIDTMKAAVAETAIRCGAEIINDISALEHDPNMLRVAASSHAGVVAMHRQGTSATMQDNPQYADVVQDIFGYLDRRRDELIAAGIDTARICLDPGVGFGKTHEHNRTLVANAWKFHSLGCPLLVGHSRKAFIAKVLGDKEVDSLPGTIGVACSLARQGVQVVRVHDVAAVRQALTLFAAAGGADSHGD